MLMGEKFIKVMPICCSTGREVNNQYIIHAENMLIFQSYHSTVAEYNGDTGRLVIDNRLANSSKTTKKYLIKYLDCFPALEDKISEIKKVVKIGSYTVIDITKEGIIINSVA